MHLAAPDNRAEMLALDARFAAFPTAEPSRDLLVVEIDDASLEQIGRWPWPRRDLADLIEVLFQCGARRVALDLILPEPQPVRMTSAAWEIHPRRDRKLLGSGEVVVFDDLDLEKTIREHGVYLAMHMESGADAGEPRKDSAIARHIRAALDADPNAAFAAVYEALGEDQRTGTESEVVAKGLYLRYRSLAVLRPRTLPADALGGYHAEEGSAATPLALHAAHAGRVGFVNFVPGADGLVRKLPMLARTRDRAHLHMAFGLALDTLAEEHGGSAQLTPSADGILAAFPDGSVRRVPVDDKGRVTINWRPDEGEAGDKNRTRMSAGSLVPLLRVRRAIRERKARERLSGAEVGQARRPESDAAPDFPPVSQGRRAGPPPQRTSPRAVACEAVRPRERSARRREAGSRDRRDRGRHRRGLRRPVRRLLSRRRRVRQCAIQGDRVVAPAPDRSARSGGGPAAEAARWADRAGSSVRGRQGVHSWRDGDRARGRGAHAGGRVPARRDGPRESVRHDRLRAVRCPGALAGRGGDRPRAGRAGVVAVLALAGSGRRRADDRPWRGVLDVQCLGRLRRDGRVADDRLAAGCDAAELRRRDGLSPAHRGTGQASRPRDVRSVVFRVLVDRLLENPELANVGGQRRVSTSNTLPVLRPITVCFYLNFNNDLINFFLKNQAQKIQIIFRTKT